MNRTALHNLVNTNVLTGGRRTKAIDLRSVLDNLIDSAVNTSDANVAGGYLAISPAGLVDISFIKSATPSGLFLKDDGTWAAASGGSSDLATVLSNGYFTGGSPIVSDDEGTELRVLDSNKGYFINSYGVVGITNEAFVNPNKIQLSASSTKIGHLNLIEFDSAVYNFTNVTPSTYAYFDSSGNLISGAAPLTSVPNLATVLLAGNSTGGTAMRSNNSKSQLILQNLGGALSYFDGSETVNIQAYSGTANMTYDDGAGIFGTVELVNSGITVSHTTSVFVGTDNGVSSAYSGYTPVTARLTYYNASNSGGIRIEDGSTYIDHTLLIYLDSPEIVLAQGFMKGVDGYSTLSLAPLAAILAYDNGVGVSSFFSANDSQVHWSWSDGVSSVDVSGDATSLNFYHSNFIFASAPIQVQYLRNISGNSAINTSGFLYDGSVVVSIDWNNRYLRNSAAGIVADWDSQYLYTTTGSRVMNWNARQLTDASLVAVLDWNNSILTGNWSLTGGDFTLYQDPTSSMHAATKNYVDNAVIGLKFKTDSVAMATGNVTISSPGTAVFDGITLSNGDRLLLPFQTDQKENGQYIFNGAGSPLTRPSDADTGTEIANKTFPVNRGTLYADTWWTCTNDTITIGVTNIVFTQTAGAGTYTNGAGITLAGNVFSIAASAVTNGMLAGSIADGKLASSYVYADGTRALTGNWAAGNFYISAAQFGVGTGTTTPSSILHIVETSTAIPRGILVDQYSTGTSGARITMRKARGTFASPLVIVTGDALASWTASAYDGAAFIESCKILCMSTGTLASGVIPSTMAFQTMTAAGVLTTALTLDQLQNATFAGRIAAVSVTLSSYLNEAQGANIASAGTTNIGAGSGNYISITGTTTITAFDTIQAGTRRVLTFVDSLTITHNGTSLILPGGNDILTNAGDSAVFISLGSGNWICTAYQRNNLLSLGKINAMRNGCALN